MATVATAFLPASAGSDVVTQITSALSDNIAPILVLVGFGVGLKLVLRMFSKSTKGRI
jgi:hypothetical protein